ncbi:MAG: TIGR04086 family membrane protein [Clostridia bacterium]|nr:TIGR04086 family membrane protein [Clostridia bacterium]
MQVNFIKNCLKGVLAAIVSSTVLLLVLSFIAYTRADPDSYVPIFAGIALYVSAFICGFVAVKKNRESGLLCGLVSGAIFTVLIVALSLAMRTSDAGGSSLKWVMYLVVLGISILGGVVGVPSGKAKRNKRGKHA